RQRTEFTEEDAEDLASDNLQSADELGLDVSAAQNWD
ncbi:MAG: hypothetical protein ACI810_001921, partial [Gammaproteobacteria bacterium]